MRRGKVWNFGEFRERVTLQTRVSGQDAHGQATESWQDVGSVWAKVSPLRGREFFSAAQVQSAVDTRIEIRWRADVDREWRAVWKGTAYDIVSAIDPDARNHVLELMCVRGVRNSIERQALPGSTVPARTLYLNGRPLSLNGKALVLPA